MNFKSLFKKFTGVQETEPDVFLNSSLQNTSAECRIRITEFQKVYDSLSEGYKKQGLSGSQITDTLWARLSAICPQCGWRIKGEDLGSIWMMGGIGFNHVAVSGSSQALRPDKGNSPNETCSSNEIVLRWEACPADDLSPFTAKQGDREALKAYWGKLAQQWWNAHDTKDETICGKCHQVSIPKGEGYFSEIFSELFCASCCERRLAPDRLETIYQDKASVTRNELRMARELADIPDRRALNWPKLKVEEKSERHCPSCDNILPADAIRCNKCGHRFM